MKHLKGYNEGFFDTFKKKNTSWHLNKFIKYNDLVEMSNDTFLELTDKGYEVLIKKNNFEPYVKILKFPKENVNKDTPYKFIDVKDEVLSFHNRLKEYDIDAEYVFIYEERRKGTLSLERDKPTYEILESGEYDNRELIILNIWIISLDIKKGIQHIQF